MSLFNDPVPASTQATEETPTVPQEGNQPNPVDDNSTQPVVEQPETDSSEGTDEQAAAAESAQQQEASPQQQIAELATSVGVDPALVAGFNDVASAQAAILMQLDAQARQGIQASATYTQPVQPVQQPAQPAPVQQQAAPAQAQSVEPLDLSALGIADDDPAAKAIRALEQRLTSSASTVDQIAQEFQRMQQAQQQQQHAELTKRAESVVDTFKSEHFGVGDNRTAQQEWSRQRLFDLADSLYLGAHAAGRPLPDLNTRLAQAKLIFESQASGVIGQPAATPAPGQTPATPAAGSINTQPPATEMKLTDEWSQNPDLLKAIAAKG